MSRLIPLLCVTFCGVCSADIRLLEAEGHLLGSSCDHGPGAAISFIAYTNIELPETVGTAYLVEIDSTVVMVSRPYNPVDDIGRMVGVFDPISFRGTVGYGAGTRNPCSVDVKWDQYTLNEYKTGDVNRDGVFNSSDLVQIFVAGEYEDAIENNSFWFDGDSNGDLDVRTEDLVNMFRDGYSTAAIPVPEPAVSVLGMLIFIGLIRTKKAKLK